MTGPEHGRFIEGRYFKLPNRCCQFFLVMAIREDDGERADLLVKWAVQEHDDWHWAPKEAEAISITGRHYTHCREYAPFGEERES